MVKITPRQAEAFVGAPDAVIRGVLVYGADRGLVRERAEKLCRSVVDDPMDPFKVAELGLAVLTKEPSLLYEEAAAISLTGGRRVVRVRDASDRLAGMFGEFLAAPPGDALVVVEAAELAGSSKLRKAFEAAKTGAALACYRDEGRDLARVIDEELKVHGLTADRDASGLMAAYLGGDRLLTRAEIAKLAVYMGSDGAVSTADVEAIMADGSFLSLERIAQAVLVGRLADLARALDRALAEREQPVVILGSVRREVQRLDLYLGLLATGSSPGAALEVMRLDVRRQFRIVEPLRAAGQIWSPAWAAAALDILMEADLLAKSTGYRADTICRDALTRIAAGVGRKRRAA